MRHKWDGNVCVNCGIKKKRTTVKLLMAISNNPPYNHYKYESVVYYYYDGIQPIYFRNTAGNCTKDFKIKKSC